MMDDKPIERDLLDLERSSGLDLERSANSCAPKGLGETASTADPEALQRHPKALDLGGDTPVEGSALSAEVIEQMTADIVAAIKTVYDPEIPADVYELGLIYKIELDDDRNVDVLMTLTAPGCPVAGEMPIWVENAVASVAGVGQVKVELTFDPPWDMGRMSDEARLALNMF